MNKTQVFKDFLGQLVNALPAETQSRQSDLKLPKINGPEFYGAENSINCLLTLSCLGVNPFQEEFVRNFFHKKAHARDLQGKWKIVDRLVHCPHFAPGELIGVLLDEESPHELFGNRLPRIIIISKGLRWIPMYRKDTRPVKRKQFKRGYRDKGSLGKDKVPVDRETKEKPEELFSCSTTWFSKIATWSKRYTPEWLSGSIPTFERAMEQREKLENRYRKIMKLYQDLDSLPDGRFRKLHLARKKVLRKINRVSFEIYSSLSELYDIRQLAPEEVSLLEDVRARSRDDRIPSEACLLFLEFVSERGERSRSFSPVKNSKSE